MDAFFYWSGVLAWGALSIVGVLYLADYALSWIVEDLWTKREFLAFVADRLKKGKPS